MIEIIGTAINQWDSGRSVRVTDVEASHVHFANQGDSKAVVMELVEEQALIPDYLLQTGKQLCVYAVLNGVTVESRVFPVKKRERPENYVYEDDQRNYIYELITDAQEATKAANQVAQDLIKAKERGEFNGPKGDPGTALIDDSVVGEAAWSSKNAVDKLCPSFAETGVMVTCEPVEGYPLAVAADESATTITRCGKNLGKPRSLTTDIIQGMTSKTEANGVMSVNGTATAEATNVYVTNVAAWGKQVFLGKGTYTFNCEVLQGSFTKVTGVLQIGAVGGGTTYEYFTPGTPHTFTIAKDSNVNTILQFRVGGTADNAKVRVQYERGNTATAVEPYTANTFAPGEDVPALAGVNNIWADAGEVTVTGRADPVAIINKLSNAVTAMSSDV